MSMPQNVEQLIGLSGELRAREEVKENLLGTLRALRSAKERIFELCEDQPVADPELVEVYKNLLKGIAVVDGRIRDVSQDIAFTQAEINKFARGLK